MTEVRPFTTLLDDGGLYRAPEQIASLNAFADQLRANTATASAKLESYLLDLNNKGRLKHLCGFYDVYDQSIAQWPKEVIEKCTLDIAAFAYVLGAAQYAALLNNKELTE